MTAPGGGDPEPQAETGANRHGHWPGPLSRPAPLPAPVSAVTSPGKFGREELGRRVSPGGTRLGGSGRREEAPPRRGAPPRSDPGLQKQGVLCGSGKAAAGVGRVGNERPRDLVSVSGEGLAAWLARGGGGTRAPVGGGGAAGAWQRRATQTQPAARARAARDHEPRGHLQRPAHHSLPKAHRPALLEPRCVGHRVVGPPCRLARSGGREAPAHPHPCARQVGRPGGAPAKPRSLHPHPANTIPEPARSRAPAAVTLRVAPPLSPLGPALAGWGEPASREKEQSYANVHFFSPLPSPLLLLGFHSPHTKNQDVLGWVSVGLVLFVVAYM